MLAFLILFSICGHPKEAAKLGTFPTGLNMLSEPVIGMTGRVQATFYVWPSRMTSQQVERKLRKMSEAERAANLYLITTFNSTVQDALSQIMYKSENETPENARRMLGYLGIALDRLAHDGRAIAKVRVKSENRAVLSIVLPIEKLELEAVFTPDKS
jgi:hypothetical protein